MSLDEPIVVPLLSRKRHRAQLAQKVQHAVPGFVLLFAGLQSLTESPHGLALLLAIVEVVSSVLLLGNVAFAVRTHRRRMHGPPHAAHPAHHGVEWADMFAAAVVIAEGFEHRMHGGHHFPRPAMLTAATLLILGLFHGRILRFAERRRLMTIAESGIDVPGRPFRHTRLRARWSDLKSIVVGERWAVITAADGRERKLDLALLDDDHKVRAALETAREHLNGLRGDQEIPHAP